MIVKLKKLKEQKKCVIKREFIFVNYKDCLFNGEAILKLQQTFNRVTTYPYRTLAVKMCENEMMVVKDWLFYSEIVLKQ